MEVWIPPGELVGEIIQEFSLLGSNFKVHNRHLQVIYRIEGPHSLPCVSYGKDIHFRVKKSNAFKQHGNICFEQIYSSDGATQLGNINYQWDQIQAAYYLSLSFPAQTADTRHKALLLGATFLLVGYRLSHLYINN